MQEEPIEQPPEEATEEELKKLEEEKQKKIAEETEEITTTAKRPGAYLYVHGQRFIAGDTAGQVRVRFTFEGQNVEADAVFKNETKLGCVVPDIEGVPVGQHLVTVEVTVNGQQFTEAGKSFLYNSVDKNLSEEDLKKMAEAEEKAKKAAAGKKK